MGRTDLTDALKEAYATAQSDVLYLDTIEIVHPDVDAPIRLIADRVGRELVLEDDSLAFFQPCGFRFVLPAAGNNGVQELTIAIDNVDRRASDFVKQVSGSKEPVTVTYRPFLLDGEPTLAMNPPLILFLTDVVITATEVTGRATFADILNRDFLSVNYSRRNFPGL